MWTFSGFIVLAVAAFSLFSVSAFETPSLSVLIRSYLHPLPSMSLPFARSVTLSLSESLMEYLWFEVPGWHRFVNITPKIEELVTERGCPGGCAWSTCTSRRCFITDEESRLRQERL
jgi:hypothetical protein